MQEGRGAREGPDGMMPALAVGLGCLGALCLALLWLCGVCRSCGQSLHAKEGKRLQKVGETVRLPLLGSPPFVGVDPSKKKSCRARPLYPDKTNHVPKVKREERINSVGAHGKLSWGSLVLPRLGAEAREGSPQPRLLSLTP
jgi:hypothetical protein